MNPLSLQSGPPPNRGPKSIAEFIQRVNAEPGGFRALNQSELRRQIEAKNKHDGDVDMDDVPEVDNAAKAKELITARDELLKNINIAYRTAMSTLNLISLLLSKETPVQAATTLTPELRNLVGIGSLGATTLDAPTTLTQSRIPDNKMAAIGMRLLAVNKAADSLESAAKRLETEINLETMYWNEVREASERGWSVFRHPDEPHTMGVKFGFSSAAPDFKANSIAPMRRAEDGTVRLEHGRLAGVSKRLQVTISQNDKVVGQSFLPRPLQDHVKEARDTVFAQELWHELNREGRTLLAHDVRLRKDAVIYTDDAKRTVGFRLVALDEADDQGSVELKPEDAEAERINNILHLLLINAHRHNGLKRSEQGIPSANRGPTPPYNLLLPLITDRKHEKVMSQCIGFLSALCNSLRAAGLNTFFTLTEPAISGTSTESLAVFLLNPTGAEFDLTITPESRLRILAKPSSTFGTRFQVCLLPPLQPDQKNPLVWSYPPASDASMRTTTNDILYDNTAKLFQYLHSAVPRALTWHYKALLLPEIEAAAQAAAEAAGRDRWTKWIVDTFNTALVDDVGEYGVRFDFPIDNDSGHPQLHVVGDFVEGDSGKTHREWTWTPAGGSGRESLSNVIGHVLANRPTS
ncbi:subunit 17 of mediator complex-domain-containing protein [Lasiosphaeria hispida]|uniref:Mediator of RNA polymerase II transcription subunit 17 n=1 Tax=Lasiosphaeria hispida TaxID=260671 RepID=A0AAJ0HVK4_9PEZI|nr:subunit 17 of mediator complex-domain-containing protein [Lasiosphaeria hispida]